MRRTAPNIENGKVKRKPYKELRTREYLTPDEVERLMENAWRNFDEEAESHC